MKKLPWKQLVKAAALPLAVVLVLVCFMTGLNSLTSGRSEEGRDQLESAVRRAAAACYATEGIYPPDLAYLEEHYALQIDRDQYTVYYDVFGSNMMPDITVLVNEA